MGVAADREDGTPNDAYLQIQVSVWNWIWGRAQFSMAIHMTNKWLFSLIGGVAALAFQFQASASALVVPGTASPWLAGMPDGSTANFQDSAPGQSPVLAPITVTGGAVIQWSARGITGHPNLYGDQVGPDGSPSNVFGHSSGAENGISDVTSPINALLGVFLGPNQPDLISAPGALSFATAAARDYLSLSPALQQVFFMGDGLTSGSVAQSLVAPAGATRLYLGTMDGFGWWNNIGTVDVNITSSANGVPEPGSMLVLMSLGSLSLLGIRRLSRV